MWRVEPTCGVNSSTSKISNSCLEQSDTENRSSSKEERNRVTQKIDEAVKKRGTE